MFHQPSGADMVGKQDGEVHPWLLREKACPFAIAAANGCSGGLICGSIRAKSSASPVRAAAEKPRLRAFLPVMPHDHRVMRGWTAHPSPEPAVSPSSSCSNIRQN